MDEAQKKNLIVLGVVGAGGLALFLVMRGRSSSGSPVQATTPVFSSGYPGGSSYYTPSPTPPPGPNPHPGPQPIGCFPPLEGCPPGTTWNQDICGCYGGGPTVCQPPAGGCGDGQVWAQALCACVPSPLPIPPNIGCLGDALGGGCPNGTHCVNGWCVPDIGNLLTDMHLPTHQPVPMGGASPSGGVDNNIYGVRQDGRPSGYADPNESLYNWNLTSAYYAMRFS